MAILELPLALRDLREAALLPFLLDELLARNLVEAGSERADPILIDALGGRVAGEKARRQHVALQDAPGRDAGPHGQ
jgi:hypothetical protein